MIGLSKGWGLCVVATVLACTPDATRTSSTSSTNTSAGSGGSGGTTNSNSSSNSNDGGSGGGGGTVEPVQWAGRFGDASLQTLNGLGLDSGSGAVVLAGEYYGTFDFGGSDLKATGEGDTFVAKLEADGTHIWSSGSGKSTRQAFTDVAVNPGGLVAVGSYHNPIGGPGLVSFGATGAPCATPSEIMKNNVVVVSLNAEGVCNWFRMFSLGTDGAATVAVAVDGDLTVVAGHFRGELEISQIKTFKSNDNLVDDLFMIGLKTSNGDELWTEHYSEPEQQRLQDVAIEPGSNIVVVGELVGALNFGGKHLVSAGQLDGFAAKLTISDRAQVWAQRFGGTSSDHANSVAVDASGHVYVGGKFRESIDFGKGLVENGGGSDAYVLALDGSDGATKWVATAGDGFEQQVTHVVLHPNGDVFAAGDFWGALDFGLGPLETNGQSDAFAIRFAPTGTPSWQMAFGGPEDDTVGGMGANGLALWLAGKTSGNWQLGPYTLDGNDNDIFIAKLSIDE